MFKIITKILIVTVISGLLDDGLLVETSGKPEPSLNKRVITVKCQKK